MSRGTVFLYDIDGTIISTGGAARGALETAIATFIGREQFRASFGFGGMTDPIILSRSLAEAGVTVTDEVLEQIMDLYLDRLDAVLASSTVYRVHEGVRASIAALEGRDGVALGLGTGNVERGARIKLARVDLNRHFAFGGFGDDSGDRAELIAAGIARGASALGLDVAAVTTVVIGDTVRDIDAAHANGAKAVAVGTGGVALETLREAGADHVYESLASPGALDALVNYV